MNTGGKEKRGSGKIYFRTVRPSKESIEGKGDEYDDLKVSGLGK